MFIRYTNTQTNTDTQTCIIPNANSNECRNVTFSLVHVIGAAVGQDRLCIEESMRRDIICEKRKFKSAYY